MRCLVVFTALGILALPACGNRSSSGSGATRTVLVDYSHDEFASAFLGYFPRNVEARPDDTIRFRQTWTGEPHSVTMGTLVDNFVPFALDAFEKYPSEEDAPPDVLQKFESLLSPLPGMIGETGQALPAGAQPCYLDSGAPPKEKACAQRAQPPFNGRQTFYNSGFIPYEGERGNKFEVKLSDDIKPGKYSYYCNYHFVEMSGTITVKPAGSDIPSQSAVSRAAKKELDAIAAPNLRALRRLESGSLKDPKLPAAGYILDPPPRGVLTFVDEFVPKTLRVKVGQKVTWQIVGPHTVSFNVPKYFPLFTVAKNGTVRRNPQSYEAVGWPAPPEPPEDAPPDKVVDQDVGEWDGSGGFKSSGVPDAERATFSMRFTKRGTYEYACVLHPPMIGKVIVK